MSDPSTDFHSWQLKWRGLTQRCAFWGFRWHCSPFWWWNTPKTTILGHWIGIFKPNCKILKVSYYWDDSIDFNQTLHNDRDHQVVIVGVPNRDNKSKTADGHILKKPLNRHICATVWWILMKFGTVTQIDPVQQTIVKILNFWLYKVAAAAILKITKIAKSMQRFDQSLRYLVRWCKMGLFAAATVKKFEFQKSRMADGSHFENRKIAISV